VKTILNQNAVIIWCIILLVVVSALVALNAANQERAQMAAEYAADVAEGVQR